MEFVDQSSPPSGLSLAIDGATATFPVYGALPVASNVLCELDWLSSLIRNCEPSLASSALLDLWCLIPKVEMDECLD